MTIYSLDVLLFLFGTSLLFHVQFYLLLPALHTGFSRGRSGGLEFPSLSENFPQFIVVHTVKGLGIVKGIVNKSKYSFKYSSHVKFIFIPTITSESSCYNNRYFTDGLTEARVSHQTTDLGSSKEHQAG